MGQNGRTQEAIEKYTEALALDPSNDSYNTALYANRAAAYMKQRKWSEAAQDCTDCLDRDENYFKARMRRAQCLYYLGEEDNLEMAVRDLEAAKRAANDRETLSQIEQEYVWVSENLHTKFYPFTNILFLTACASIEAL